MRTFNITVNGKTYEVEVEEVGGVSSAPTSLPEPKVETAPQKTAAPKIAAPAGSSPVKAPMPGTVLDIKVSVGQSVKSGDVLVILEAMKMENEIMADRDGTVVSVNTTKGASVNSGDILVSLN